MRDREFEVAKCWGEATAQPQRRRHTQTPNKKLKNYLSLSLCNTLYQIHTAWRSWIARSLLLLPILMHSQPRTLQPVSFTGALRDRNVCIVQHQKCIQTDIVCTHCAIHIWIRMWGYTLCSSIHTRESHLHMISYGGFVRLCVCIQVESKRVSYFDCRNHMQIHRKNLFFPFKNDYCNSISST